jgi:hypothetical protein
MHIPALDRSDDEFYAPLAGLTVGGARIYVGLIHSMRASPSALRPRAGFCPRSGSRPIAVSAVSRPSSCRRFWEITSPRSSWLELREVPHGNPYGAGAIAAGTSPCVGSVIIS